MALTKSLWTSIVDLVSTGQTISGNLDTAFANMDLALTQIDTNTSSIAELQGLAAAASVITTSPIAAQVLVANVPEKLNWMTTALVDEGTAITIDIPTDNLLVNESGTYRVYGVVSALVPVNNLAEIELYIDNLPTGFKSSCVGRGQNSVVTYAYSFLTPFLVNDDINLYVTSTGTEITIQSASVTVEKTNY